MTLGARGGPRRQGAGGHQPRRARTTLEGDISLKKAEEMIGKPIFWQVPNDAKAVIGPRAPGEPLVQHAPKCRAQQSI